MADRHTPAFIAGAFAANRPLNSREADKLMRAGVLLRSLEKPFPVRVGSVVFVGPNRFEFAHGMPLEGERVLLFLAANVHGMLADVVAWHPRSGRFATWLGQVWALGEDRVLQPRLDRCGALRVWRTPLGWLRSGRAGLVLLSPHLAAMWLCDAAPLMAEDLGHRFEIRNALGRPAPRIIFENTARAA